MLNSSFWDQSNGYILVNGTIATPNTARKAKVQKNYGPFTDCIGEKINTQIDNAKDIDVVMSAYNLNSANKNSALFNFKTKIADRWYKNC